MSAQARLNIDLIHLQRAALCADCEVISEAKNGHCAACGSQALLNLSRVLGGSIGSQACIDLSSSMPIPHQPQATPVLLAA
jgi:hypothetical protein